MPWEMDISKERVEELSKLALHGAAKAMDEDVDNQQVVVEILDQMSHDELYSFIFWLIEQAHQMEEKLNKLLELIL